MWIRYAWTSPSGGEGRTWRVLRRGSRRAMLWFTRFVKPAWAVVEVESDGECDKRVVRPFVRTYLSRSIYHY